MKKYLYFSPLLLLLGLPGCLKREGTAGASMAGQPSVQPRSRATTPPAKESRPAAQVRTAAQARAASRPAPLTPKEVLRLSPQKVRQRVKAGKALFVCAYSSEKAFQRVRLSGAISYPAFLKKLPRLPRTQELIFYCA